MNRAGGPALVVWLMLVGCGAAFLVRPVTVETQRGTTAPGDSARIATPAVARPWTAEIQSEGPAVLVIECDGVEIHVPAPGRALVEDGPETSCAATVEAPGPRVAQWAVTTRLEATE